jgi:predicted RNA binding protein YcfA (HicA-like mRNA interferase family)
MKAVTGKVLVRVLGKKGWRLARVHGSHHILVKEGVGRALAIPVHGNRPLKVGLLKAVMRTADLTEDDF